MVILAQVMIRRPFAAKWRESGVRLAVLCEKIICAFFSDWLSRWLCMKKGRVIDVNKLTPCLSYSSAKILLKMVLKILDVFITCVNLSV